MEFAIYQTAWDPEQLRRHLESARQVARKQREERLRDARLMDRVSRYSDSDDDEENDLSFSAGGGPRPRMAGVTSAWKKDDAG